MICMSWSPSSTSVSSKSAQIFLNSGEATFYHLNWVAMHPVETWSGGLITGRRERP